MYLFCLLNEIQVVSIELFHSHFARFCTIEYVFDGLKLSLSDVIVAQKGYNGEGKLHFFRWDYNFTRSL